MKIMKKISALILAFAIAFGALGLCGRVTASASAKRTVEFGSYPQSRVTDSSLVAELDGIDASWISYGYYSGNGSIGSAEPSDYMTYKDVTLNGEKYRAVYFSSCRPMKTHETHSSKSYQSANGYTAGNVYWFKYEPLKWRILDENTGLMMCESIIDSQPFNEFVCKSGSAYYNSSSHRAYAYDYESSSLRQWLNDDFYNTAFSPEEKEKISSSAVSLQYYPSGKGHGSTDVSDKVFLLSRNQATDSSYGFSSSMYSSDSARRGRGTDYAKCQGLHVCEIGFSGHLGNSCWWLCAPGFYSRRVNKIFYDGYCAVDSYYYVELTDIGVRPCITVK